MATRALNPRRPSGRRPAGRAERAAPRPRLTLRGAVIRRRVIAGLLALVVIYASYTLWFRNLSLFAIDQVTITGATTSQGEIKAAVERAARDMTTLHLNDGELRDAVAQFPTVATVGASTGFPHTPHVTVTERLPVAFIKVGGTATAVSADGYLLRGASFDPKHLPRIDGTAQGVRLDADAAAETAILGATPDPLRDHVTSSSWSDQDGGVVVSLDNGPDLRFGDGSRARDKWTAALAVLSSSEHGSPSYLDVSVPDRPVSGG
jgi:cell division protein FtsQ